LLPRIVWKSDKTMPIHLGAYSGQFRPRMLCLQWIWLIQWQLWIQSGKWSIFALQTRVFLVKNKSIIVNCDKLYK
jgi:hypothetical protein